MTELNDFHNEGFRWVCRQCEREFEEKEVTSDEISRLLSEGEAESKRADLSTRGLAKWADAAQRILICPRCGISESVEKS